MKQELYLVTGAMGHLGNVIIRKLLKRGYQVRGLALPGDELVPIQHPNYQLVRGDVCDQDSIRPLFEQTDGAALYVIHTAGIVSIASKFQQKVFDVNVLGTRNVVSLCQEYQVDKLVYVSTVHAIPEQKKGQVITEVNHFDPEQVKGLYARTKAEASQIVLDAAEQGLNASIVHPSGIIGPGDFGRGHLTQLIIDFMNRKLTACVRGGYDFVDVRDVADAILSCVKHGRQGECYICSNQYFDIKEVLDLLHDISGNKAVKTVLPTWFAKATAPLAELYYKALKQPPLYTSYSLFTLQSNGLFSHDKATKELGYAPRPIRATLEDTVKFLYEHRRIKKVCKLNAVQN